MLPPIESDLTINPRIITANHSNAAFLVKHVRNYEIILSMYLIIARGFLSNCDIINMHSFENVYAIFFLNQFYHKYTFKAVSFYLHFYFRTFDCQVVYNCTKTAFT